MGGSRETADDRVEVQFDVPAAMRDGTVLRANVYRPSGGGRHPVLLTRLPYGKDLALGTSVLDPVQAARRGYLVVVQDTRGRFRSEGEWYPYATETDDGVDTIAWAAALPGADGQVGMYGASYYGQTQWLPAAERPPALRAMVPFITYADPFNGAAYRGGALELGLLANWHLQVGFEALIRRHQGDLAALYMAVVTLVHDLDRLGPEGYASLPLRDFAPLVRNPVAPAFFDTFGAGAGTAPQVPIVKDRHAEVEVPTFNIGGWYDVFLDGTLDNFRAMRDLGRPAKLLVGPWSHVNQSNPIGELNFGFGSQTALIDLRSDLAGLQLRWFDHWLKGIDTGMLDEPPVKYFLMGANVWREAEDWPPPGVRPMDWHLHPGGSLHRRPPDASPGDSFDYDPADPVPTLGGAVLMTPEFRAGPYDQRAIEARPDVLVYSSDPLSSDLEVTGPVRAHLWVTSSAPDTDFVARLCDVHPDGRSFNLTDGITRARYRGGQAGGLPVMLEPDRPAELVIDMWSTAHVFRAGHRLRVHVTSSSFPRWDRNPNTGHRLGADAELAVAHQRILHDPEHPSRVVITEMGSWR